ncbi:hypothetical protein K435DRAFT_166178 [Dendrothele bispora CBS 962.96]|uniref:Uncharacterized protein n=1 Tax=Dendrothele bispora (strain CBS 962.96) TaxID=1314807 RepID=A0A4S8KLD4_DENBC|nr:hypothetical protein K435DRAFT_166178 [Dendrothele bispora CBS 962.96]
MYLGRFAERFRERLLGLVLTGQWILTLGCFGVTVSMICRMGLLSANDQIEDFKQLKNQLVSRGETITTLEIAYDGSSSSSLDKIQKVMELVRGSNISVVTTLPRRSMDFG